MAVPTELRFVSYVLGIYVAFVNWGLLQEKLMTYSYGAAEECPSSSFGFSIFLNCCMGLAAHLTAKTCIKIGQAFSGAPTVKEVAMKPGRMEYFKASLTAAVASPTGYRALKFVSYPLSVLVKSSKAIPVMLVGVLVYKESYKWWKYLCVLLVASGIGLFMFYETKKKGSGDSGADEAVSRLVMGHDWCPADWSDDGCSSLDSAAKQATGVVLLFINLTLDGFTNNEQDAINKNKAWSVTSLDMMQGVNYWQVGTALLYHCVALSPLLNSSA